MRARLAVLLLALALTAAPRRARGEDVDPSRYAPVPPAIAEVVGDPADEETARTAAQETLAPDEPTRRAARARLVLLGDVGLKHAAARLAAGAPAASAPHLLRVVAVADHPEADAVLEKAAGEPWAELRVVAAEGLARGRGPRAVPTLALLARDETPSVRAAALRALFALDGPDAVAARVAIPEDARPDLLRMRLLLHRLREDASAEVLRLADRAWLGGATAAVRTEAARLLCLPALRAPVGRLADVLDEAGDEDDGLALARRVRGLPTRGHDPAAMRAVAIEAGFALLARPEVPAADRADVVDRLVGWLARPVRLADARGRGSVPEDALRTRLPDLGPRVLEPVLQRLRAGAFSDPRDGVHVVQELAPGTARPALLALLVDETVPDAVRSAAATGLSRLGLGDEAVARRFLEPAVDRTIRRDVLSAVTVERAPWAIPLLAAEAARPGDDLLEEARDALEARPEPEARRALEELLFRHPLDAARRILPLVRPADDAAWALLERALADPRYPLRHAALGAIVDLPALRGPRGRALVLAYETRSTQRAERTRELERWIRSLEATAPEEAVRLVARRWVEMESLGYADEALKVLAEALGPTASVEAVDLALAKVAGEATPTRTIAALVALQGRTGHRDAEVDDLYRRALAHEHPQVVRAAVSLLDRPGRGDLVEPLLALLHVGPNGVGIEPEAAHAVLRALSFQPYGPRVEAVMLDLALDPREEAGIRAIAAARVRGHASDAGRARLLAWMRETRMGSEEVEVQAAIAAAVGEGGGPVTAAALFALLAREVEERWLADAPDAVDEDVAEASADRADALVRAIARTGDAPTMDRVVELVFDPRLAAYARSAARTQAHRLGARGAALPPPPIDEVRLATSEAPHPIPPEVSRLVGGMKATDDATLAKSLARVLGAARATGRLARFPDAYLERIAVVLLDTRGADRRRAAAALEPFVRRIEPVDGATDLAVDLARAVRLLDEGRFSDAAAAQARAVAIAARRGHDVEDPSAWRRETSRRDALVGADLAARGLADNARDAFRRAVGRAPHDPDVLSFVATLRARVGLDLPAAEAEARRAARLEDRLGRDGLASADALAATWLARGEADAAARLLHGRLDPSSGTRAPDVLLRFAQACLASGRPDEALEALQRLLDARPGLADRIRDLPWLAPLAADPRWLRTLAERAEALRRGE